MAIRRTVDVPVELLEAFVRCGDVSAYLVSALSDDVWRADTGRSRTIAANVAHMLSLRRTFARAGGAKKSEPALDRRTITRAQAVAAFQSSTRTLSELFQQALAAGRTRVPGQPRRIVDMVTYLIQHDAHHRGQIVMCAKTLGHEFTTDDVMRIWGWKKLPPAAAPAKAPRPRGRRPGRSQD